MNKQIFVFLALASFFVLSCSSRAAPCGDDFNRRRHDWKQIAIAPLPGSRTTFSRLPAIAIFFIAMGTKCDKNQFFETFFR